MVWTVKRAQSPTTWDKVCVATNYGSGQRQREVGTPENPQFTYEEALHNRRKGRKLMLYAGKDILSEESDRILESSGPSLEKLWRKVEESELPLLPQVVLPGGWDILGRPWALMDCPKAQVPQIPSAHGHSGVTIAVLVSFPPDPFYFPDLAHLDQAVQLWNKASRKRPLGMNAELQEDGQVKGAKKTYDHLRLPAYRHSVPVQEMLKELRWKAFREG